MGATMRKDPDFDWLTDDSVILEPRRALAVYLNQKGEVVLRQQADWPSDEDDIWITFPANDAEHVANQIIRLVNSQLTEGRLMPWQERRHCALSDGPAVSPQPQAPDSKQPGELFPSNHGRAAE